MLILFLLIGFLITGDEPQVVPSKTEETVKLGRLLIINVKSNGKIVKWVRSSDDVDLVPITDDGKRVIFATMTPGTHRIYGYTALGDVPSEPVVITIVAGDVPKPNPPNPPVPPVPPNPDTDPITSKFQKEYDKDTNQKSDKEKWKTQIVGLLEAIADHIKSKNTPTIGDLLSDYESARASLIPKDVLKDLRIAIGVEIFNLTGDDASKPITSELRIQLQEGFLQLAKSLKAVK